MKKDDVENQFDAIFSEKPEIKYNFNPKKLGYKDRNIVKLLLTNGIRNRRVLDIGPGTGRWLQFMYNNGAEFLGAIDISSEALKRVAPLCNKIQKANLEVDRFNFNDSFFDIVVSFEVLEHLSNPHNFLSEIKRITKKGGIIIFSLPNIVSLISRARLLVGLLPPVMAMDKTHVGFYRQKDLIELLGRYLMIPDFIPTSISLNPTNPKSRFCFRSFKSISLLDDSHLILIRL